MAPLAVFSFHEIHTVRVQVIGGEPWFCLKDVCDILSVSVASPSRFQMDMRGVTQNVTPTIGGNQQLTFVSEPNLYRVIFRSNKPEARQFQDWVFNEVLPAIRKTGEYQYLPEAPRDAGEPLTQQDHYELKWLISDVAKSFHFSRCWVNGIWFALRRATGNPSPNPFLTTDLPIIVHELRRVLRAAEYAQMQMRRYESDVLKTMVRGGQDAAAIRSLGLNPADTMVDSVSLPARFEVALGKLIALEHRVANGTVVPACR